jgi:hypothetical protein
MHGRKLTTKTPRHKEEEFNLTLNERAAISPSFSPLRKHQPQKMRLARWMVHAPGFAATSLKVWFLAPLAG